MFLPPASPSPSEPPWTHTSRRSLHERIILSLRYLSDEIEARRVGGLGEAQAAGYLAGRLRRADFAAAVQSFRVSTGAQWTIAYIAALGMIAGVIGVLWQSLAGAIIAGVLILIALLWLAAESRGSDPLRGSLRGKTSQSVVGARAATSHQARLRVLIIAPLDSSPPPVLRLWERVILVSSLLVIAGALAGMLGGAAAWWRLITLGASCVVAVLWVWIMRRLLRPVPIPAISGAGDLTALLMIAEELQPLKTIEVWAIAVGGSSSGQDSVDALLERYPFSPHDTCVINLHAVNAGQPCFVTREGAFRQQRADRMLLALADEIDAANPTIDAAPCQLRQRTLGYILQRQGFPALTISSHHDGAALTSPDAATIERCVRLVVGMVQALDEP